MTDLLSVCQAKVMMYFVCVFYTAMYKKNFQCGDSGIAYLQLFQYGTGRLFHEVGLGNRASERCGMEGA